MICILKHNMAGDLIGFIIAADTADARRRTDLSSDRELAEYLYRVDGIGEPYPGKRELPIITVDGSKYTLLVQ